MKVAIMQPYFLPYIGYFQLLNYVDKFVIYDDIQYTKKGWINRNRIRTGDMITIPIKKASDYLDIQDRFLSDDWSKQRKKLENKIYSCYIKSENYSEGSSLLESILHFQEKNLFKFIFNSINTVNNYLNIHTEIIKSSSLKRSRELKAQDSVLQICKMLEADTYVNLTGGRDLYCKNYFEANNVELKFIENRYTNTFSIIDLIMNNRKEDVEKAILEKYEIE